MSGHVFICQEYRFFNHYAIFLLDLGTVTFRQCGIFFLFYIYPMYIQRSKPFPCVFNNLQKKVYGILKRLRSIKSETGATSGAGTAYPFGAFEFTSGVQWGSCYTIFSFLCCILQIVVCPLSFFFWPLCCLSISFSFGHCVVCPSSIDGF